MKTLRYLGPVAKTLIDIAALEPDTTFTVDDDTADRLVASAPTEYEVVQDKPAKAAKDTTDTKPAKADDSTPPTNTPST